MSWLTHTLIRWIMNVRGTNTLETSAASSFCWSCVAQEQQMPLCSGLRSGSDNPSLIISLCVIWIYSCTLEDMKKVFFQQSIQRSALLFWKWLLNVTTDICCGVHSFHLDLDCTTAWWKEILKLLHSFWNKLDNSCQNYILLSSFYVSGRRPAQLMTGFPLWLQQF